MNILSLQRPLRGIEIRTPAAAAGGEGVASKLAALIGGVRIGFSFGLMDTSRPGL